MSKWNKIGPGPTMNGKPSVTIMRGMEMVIIISAISGRSDENEAMADHVIDLLDENPNIRKQGGTP